MMSHFALPTALSPDSQVLQNELQNEPAEIICARAKRLNLESCCAEVKPVEVPNGKLQRF